MESRLADVKLAALSQGYRPVALLLYAVAGLWSGVVLLPVGVATFRYFTESTHMPGQCMAQLWASAGLALLGAGAGAMGLIYERRQLGFVLLTVGGLAGSLALIARFANAPMQL